MIKTTWVDPNDGKAFSYDWGYDTSEDAARMPAEFYKKERTTMSYKDYVKYTRHDVATTAMLSRCNVNFADMIEDVIFNDPATIIKWKDGTKTVVKVQEGDMYDPSVGFAMAVCKKVFGNKGNFNEVFKKWVPEYKTSTRVDDIYGLKNFVRSFFGLPAEDEVEE